MTNTPCRSRNGTTEHQVEIGGTHYWFRAEQLESVPLAESPLDLLAAGSLGDVSDLRRAMTFHRLSGRISNVIYSLDATKTDFLAYQFKPLLKLLNAPNGGLLIADEVGLGKTIEAGLIWTELRARFDARRLLVICPAVLRGKWQRELSLRFGVRAEVVDAHRAHEITRRNIEETTTPEFAMVASFQGLRPSADWEADEARDLGQHTFIDFIERHSERKLFDLVIIDEAHYGRNRGTGTAKLFHQVRQVSSHIVLLSATPIHLKNSDLFNLLNLIDPGQFSDEEPFDDIVAANRPVMALANRLLMGNATPEDFRSSLTDALRNPLLSTSRQLCALLESPPDESEIYSPAERGRLCAKLHETSLLDNVVCRTRKREVVEGRVPREPHAERVTLAPIERGLYNRVTAALKKNAATAGKRQPFLLVMPQRQLASSIPAAFREWLTRGSATVDDDDDDNDTPTPVIDSVISSLGEDFTFSELRAADTKYRRLQSVLNERLRQNPEEKIVLFAFFRPTLTYLSERLREDGIQNIVLMGGANEDNLTKDEIIDRFSAERGPRVLLSSEVGSEGIDLQFASVLINYDLPWNPMRIEQRIGRIDRKGQTASRIQIWNLVAAETIDERIYSKLYERLGIFTAALGGLEAVLGDLKNTAAELLLSDLSPAEEAERLDQTAYALEQRRREEERLEANSAVLIAHQDYILEQLGASKKLGRAITADDLSLFVRDFFHTHFRGTRIYAHEFGENEVEIILDSNCLLHFEQFARDKGYSLSSSRLFNQSTTPVRCRFDTKIADATPRNTEIINQFHPLIRFIVHTITLEGLHHHPAIAAKVPHSSCNVPSGRYAFIVQRWEIGGTRREERLHFGVIPLNSSTPLPAEDAETLITTAVLKGIPWADSAVENDLVHAAKTVDTLIQSGSAAYDRFFLELEVKRHDQAEIQARACRAVHDREVSRLVAQRERNVGHSARINPAIDGSIARLRRTYEARLAEIQDRRELIREGATELAVGIIEVES